MHLTLNQRLRTLHVAWLSCMAMVQTYILMPRWASDIWPVQASMNHDITFSLQYVAVSRLENPQEPASLATELESLMYCFLFAATKNQLHWKHQDSIIAAHGVKFACMARMNLFQDKVIYRIQDSKLQQVAVRLQELFFGISMPRPAITLQTFQACFPIEARSATAMIWHISPWLAPVHQLQYNIAWY